MFAPLPRRGPHPRMQHVMPARAWRPARTGPAATTMNSQRRTITMLRLLPHTIQLCIHCRRNPAGFWVSHNGDQTVRRPWCLSCCPDLDPACHHVTPFDS